MAWIVIVSGNKTSHLAIGGSNPAWDEDLYGKKYTPIFFENGGRCVISRYKSSPKVCVISMSKLKDCLCLEK